MGTEEEYVDVVDDKNNFLESMNRDVADNAGKRYRVSKAIVLNSKKKVLVHQRVDGKVNFPGFYDLTMAETLNTGESFEQTAVRGLKEEFDIDVGEDNLEFLDEFQYDFETGQKRYYQVFIVIYDGEFRFDPKEVQKAEFVSMDKLLEMLNNLQFKKESRQLYEKLKSREQNERCI